MMMPDVGGYYVAYITFRKVGVSNINRYFLGDTEHILEKFRDIGVSTVILQTCNRVEVYMYGDNPIDIIAKMGLNQKFASSADLYRGLDVFRHLIHVVSGLDSLAVGESQIMGQVREAFNKSREFGCLSSELEFLFSEAFKIGKRIRSKIMFRVFDYAYATLNLIGGSPSNKRVLIIGTGKMARDLLKLLVGNFSVDNIYVSGRRNLGHLVDKYGVNTFHISELNAYLGLFDVIISCVSVDKPIINASHRHYLKDGVIIIDLGVPPNVDLPNDDNVRVFDFEEVSRFISEKYSSLSDKVRILYEYVDNELGKLMERIRGRWVDEVIRRIYIRAENIRRAELDEAYRKLVRLVDDEELRNELTKLLDVFSWSLVKKIYHQHIEVFKSLGDDGKFDKETILAVINRLGGATKACD